jgi:hypothetical protein
MPEFTAAYTSVVIVHMLIPSTKKEHAVKEV